MIPAGLSPDGKQWIHPCYNGFFQPVKVLSRIFRGKFMASLKRAFGKERVLFPGSLKALDGEKAFTAFLWKLFARIGWSMPSRPSGARSIVLHYLARYTHRVAISNHRLIQLTDGQVTFRWNDYAHGSKKRK